MRVRSTTIPIVSFTLNAETVSERWEHNTPPAMARVKAAKELADIGYEVRLRIDPMVPIKNWKTHYTRFINKVFDKLTPERITIGSLRGLQSTINNCKDRTWTEYLSDRSNWGKKIDFNTRFDMYSAITNHLKETHNYDRVALCKETIEMWDNLEMDYRNMRCNCIG
jgi:spore photoproduct lyase